MISFVALVIGTSFALGVGAFASAVGLDRDRAFYPTVMIVIASLYVLFAAMAGSHRAVLVEILVGSLFVVAAVTGFRGSLWVVAAALAAHGVFDLIHGSVIVNPGVPAWWPEFCGTYDIAAAGYLAWRLSRGRIRAIV